MSITQYVYFIVYPGFEILDLAGPAAVFAHANAVLNRDNYRVETLATHSGEVTSSAGITVVAKAWQHTVLHEGDTVLVVGGEWPGLQSALGDVPLLKWLGKLEAAAVRYGSVCLGTFVLAQAGLLHHRRVTTHWEACAELAKLDVTAQIDAQAVYVEDRHLWTSAGVTTGIDMVLKMIERDHGPQVMGRVAERLVVQAHRPGDVAQRSSILQAQVEAGDLLGDVLPWIEANLTRTLKIQDLALRAGMSERNFYRKFMEQLGQTPAHYIRERRLQRAKQLIEKGTAVKRAAHEVGFQSEAAFRKAFNARFDMNPSTIEGKRE